MSEVREMTCISCPMGCHLTVSRDDAGNVTVTGFTCKRGEVYGKQEFTCPMRTVTSSVRVDGGVRPVCSVKTQNTVPKAKIPEVLDAIAACHAKAPLAIGDVVLENIADTGVNLVATSNCAKG